MGTWETPWRDGRTEIGGSSVMTVELGPDRNRAHCARISFWPGGSSPSLLLPAAVFLHRHDLPAAQRKKSAAATHSARHSILEAAAPTGSFWRKKPLPPYVTPTAVFFPPAPANPPTVEKFCCIAAAERPTKNVVPSPAHIRHTNTLEFRKGEIVDLPTVSRQLPRPLNAVFQI
jgi:hypothetical protein